MRKPPWFWERTFASLGFVRRRGKKQARPRAHRLMQIEPLESRLCLNAAPVLCWDPGDTGASGAGPSGGSGAWDTASGNTVWYNGSADVAWTNGDTAVFEGQAGKVTISSAVSAANVTFESANYMIVGGTLDLTPPSGSRSVIETDAGSATISSTLLGGPAGWTS
jgi:hypothetical protein